jgi:hypothetical protein
MGDRMNPGEEFLYWVGSCVTAWAKVEEQLFEVCLKCLGTRPELAAIIYYRTPTLDARLSLTNDLVRAVLPRPERKDGGHDHEDVRMWDKLRKEIGGLLPVRNRIAHHPVASRSIGTPPEDVTAALNELSWVELYVSESERLRGRDENTKPLLAPDLSAHRLATHEARVRLQRFISDVLSKHV